MVSNGPDTRASELCNFLRRASGTHGHCCSLSLSHGRLKLKVSQTGRSPNRDLIQGLFTYHMVPDLSSFCYTAWRSGSLYPGLLPCPFRRFGCEYSTLATDLSKRLGGTYSLE
ncbi:hypothetical protein VTI28DRAFT_1939 [Corynascus sepedonium]